MRNCRSSPPSPPAMKSIACSRKKCAGVAAVIAAGAAAIGAGTAAGTGVGAVAAIGAGIAAAGAGAAATGAAAPTGEPHSGNGPATFVALAATALDYQPGKGTIHETTCCIGLGARARPCRSFGVAGDAGCADRSVAGRGHPGRAGLRTGLPPWPLWRLPPALQLPARLAYGSVRPPLRPQPPLVIGSKCGRAGVARSLPFPLPKISALVRARAEQRGKT